MNLTIKERAFLYDYDSAIDSKDVFFFRPYFSNSGPEECTRLAKILIRYVFEHYLEWSPELVRENISMKLLKQWKLDKVLEYLSFPPEIDKRKDLFYIAILVWPEAFKVTQQDIYLAVYKRVVTDVDGTGEKFPKGYFDGADRMNRACACLRYAIANYNHQSSVDDLYSFFGNRKTAHNFLRKYKLYWPCKNLFQSPVEFLHFSLAETQKNPFKLDYYNFLYNMENVRKELEVNELFKENI